MLALDGSARAWEPKRLRLRLLSAAGRLTRGSRQTRMRIAPVAGAGAGHRFEDARAALHRNVVHD